MVEARRAGASGDRAPIRHGDVFAVRSAYALAAGVRLKAGGIDVRPAAERELTGRIDRDDTSLRDRGTEAPALRSDRRDRGKVALHRRDPANRSIRTCERLTVSDRICPIKRISTESDGIISILSSVYLSGTSI